MNTREFNLEKDYEEIKNWWISQKWDVLPPEMLTGTGFVTEDSGKLLAATWIFPTNCPVYIMEWTVGNPNLSWEYRSKALKVVTDKACNWAKEDGASMVFTMTKNKRFIDKLKNNNFIETDNDMTHLMRRL